MARSLIRPLEPPYLYTFSIYTTWLLCTTVVLFRDFSSQMPEPVTNLTAKKRSGCTTIKGLSRKAFLACSIWSVLYPLIAVCDVLLQKNSIVQASQFEQMLVLWAPSIVIKNAMFFQIWSLVLRIFSPLPSNSIVGLRPGNINFIALITQLGTLGSLIYLCNTLPCTSIMQQISWKFHPIYIDDPRDEIRLFDFTKRKATKLQCQQNSSGNMVIFPMFTLLWAISSMINFHLWGIILWRSKIRIASPHLRTKVFLIFLLAVLSTLVGLLAIILYYDLWFHTGLSLAIFSFIDPWGFVFCMS